MVLVLDARMRKEGEGKQVDAIERCAIFDMAGGTRC